MNLSPLTFRVAAHAKINATLDLLGRRPDGYHALRSVVIPVALHDDVEVALLPGAGPAPDASPAIRVEIAADGVDCSRIGPPGDNLCAKAAAAFLRRFAAFAAAARGAALRIRVVKRIPLGGGLGGGSADAAATLVALAALAGGGIGRDDLVALAAEVGSDVPALVCGGAVLMEGRGEKVTPLPGLFAPFDLLLANPGVHVSTAAAFRAFDERALTPAPISSKIVLSRNCGRTLPGFAAMLSNGLEDAVFALHPEVARIAARLREAGAAGVSMTGSGATVFALAASREDAGALAGALPAGCWHAVSRTVPDGVMAAHGPLEA